MTKPEFQAAYNLAVSEVELTADDSILDGCLLAGFSPVTATVEAVARFLRWHCCYIGGGIDHEMLTDLRNCFRRKVTMVGVDYLTPPSKRRREVCYGI
jgi:hypothetical protein